MGSNTIMLLAAVVSLLVVFGGFAAAWGILSWRQNSQGKDIEGLKEAKLDEKEHGILCKSAALEISAAFTETVTDFKDDIYENLRGMKEELKTEIKNGKV